MIYVWNQVRETMDGLSKLANVLFFAAYHFCKWIGNDSLLREKVDTEKELKENFVACMIILYNTNKTLSIVKMIRNYWMRLLLLQIKEFSRFLSQI